MRSTEPSKDGMHAGRIPPGSRPEVLCFVSAAFLFLLAGAVRTAWGEAEEVPQMRAAQESVAVSTDGSPLMDLDSVQEELAEASPQERPVLSVQPAEDVRDPVLAFLVGLLSEDILDTLEGEDIRDASVRPKRSTLIPLELLVGMGRGVGPTPEARIVSFWLMRDGKVPAPYSLLGYHPGSVLVSREVQLIEWHVGPVTIIERTRGSFLLEDCYVWAVNRGRVGIDIDAFVDRLLGGAVDDMTVNSLALFRLHGVRYAMAMGYNKKGKGRSGALNLRKNEIEFPSSWQLRSAGKLLRQKAEGLYLTLSQPPRAAVEGS